MTTFDVASLNRAQLAALYNSAAAKPVKSFSTHTIAVERVLKLAAELQLTAVVDAAGAHFEASHVDVLDHVGEDAVLKDETHAAVLAVAETVADDGETDVQRLVDASDESVDVLDVIGAAAAAPVPAPAAGPKPKRAKASQGAAVAATKRGPAPKVPDDHVLLTVGANPKRAGAANHARYALYEVGMTVGAFLDAAYALQGASRGRWRGDIAWDVEYGFITVGPAPAKEG